MVCPKCKCVNADDSRFCRNCGVELRQPAAPAKKSRWWVLFVIIAVIAAGSFAAVYFIDDEPQKKPATPEAPSAQIQYVDHDYYFDAKYEQAQKLSDLQELAEQGYLPACYSLAHFYTVQNQYEQARYYCMICLNNGYMVNEANKLLSSLRR